MAAVHCLKQWHDGVVGGGTVLAVEQKPVDLQAGEGFDDVGAAQLSPDAELGGTAGETFFEAIHTSYGSRIRS